MVQVLWVSDHENGRMNPVKRHRHTPEQAVRKLREGERMLGEGKDLADVLRHLEIAESTWNRWRSQYAGMKASGAKRLRELEAENARLKKLLARPSWTRRCSRSWPRENGDPGPSSTRRDGADRTVRGV